MEKEFATYEQSVILKELDFDEVCFGYFLTKDLPYIEKGFKIGSGKFIDKHNSYDEFTISRPLRQQAFDFIESKFGLYYQKADIKVSASETEGYRWRYCIYKIGEDEPIYVDESLLGFLNSEQLQNDCLDEMLKIIKKEKI